MHNLSAAGRATLAELTEYHAQRLADFERGRRVQRPSEALEGLANDCRTGKTSRHTIPWEEIQGRALSVAGSAGNLVSAKETDDALLQLPPLSIASQAGVRVIRGRQGHITQPVWEIRPAFEWLETEFTQLSDATPTLGAADCTPHTGGALVQVSGLLNRQSDVLETLRKTLLQSAAVGIDHGLIAGDGTGGAPVGLLNTDGVVSQSGTALAWAGICNMEEAIANADVDDGALTWVADPGTRKLLRQREAIANSGNPIWDGRTIAGHRALVSTGMPAGTLVAGDFSNATVVLWGPGVEVMVNPYNTNGFKRGEVEIAVFVAMDVAINHPGGFAKSQSIT